jgi:hypothetical protein
MHGHEPKSPSNEPLPPARTRWSDPAETRTSWSGSIIGPVRSGIHGPAHVPQTSSEPPAPEPTDAPEWEASETSYDLEESAVTETSWPDPADATDDDALDWSASPESGAPAFDEVEQTAESPDSDILDPPTADSWGAWADTPNPMAAQDDDLVFEEDVTEIELVLETDSALTIEEDDTVEDDEGDEAPAWDFSGLVPSGEADDAEDRSTGALEELVVDEVDDATGRLREDDGEMVETPAPLSQWNPAFARDPEEAEERLRRAREEWESFGELLVRSVELQNEPAPPQPQASDDVSADAPLEGLEPVGAGFDRDEPPLHEPPLEAIGQPFPQELEALARRLEQFAAALRTDGTRAMAVAQSRGDPVDLFLAGIAAGYLTGRHE